jgi:uncharacterized protein
MRAQVEILQELRQLDAGIEALRGSLRAVEGDLQRSVAEEALLQEALDREKAKLSATQRRRRDAEQEARTWSDRRVQYQTQMNASRKNEEFQAFQRQIADAAARIRDREDAQLAAMEEEETAQQNIARMDADMATKRKVAGDERGRLERERVAAQGRIEVLAARRDDLVGRLDGPVRGRYERLRTALGENVIVAVVNGTCGGCHYRLPPQVINLVRKGEELLFCEACGRMLVHAGDAD